MASFKELMSLVNQSLAHLKAGEYASAAERIGDTLRTGFYILGEIGRELFGFRSTEGDVTFEEMSAWYEDCKKQLSTVQGGSPDLLRLIRALRTLLEAIWELYQLFREDGQPAVS